MTFHEFVHQNINLNRGGYRPEEVVGLIREAWIASANATREQVVIKLGSVKHDLKDDSRHSRV